MTDDSDSGANLFLHVSVWPRPGVSFNVLHVPGSDLNALQHEGGSEEGARNKTK